jgi:hypothetical protein
MIRGRREKHRLHDYFLKPTDVRIKKWADIKKWINECGHGGYTTTALRHFRRHSGKETFVRENMNHCVLLDVDHGSYAWAYEWLEMPIIASVLDEDLFEI